MKLKVDFSKRAEKQKLFGVLQKLKPMPYELQIKKESKGRSLNQNSYYWGVVIDILSKETGFYPDEMHDVLKRKFNPKNKELAGESITVGGTTKKFTTIEMESYLEQIRSWAITELNIYIPLPNEA